MSWEVLWGWREEGEGEESEMSIEGEFDEKKYMMVLHWMGRCGNA